MAKGKGRKTAGRRALIGLGVGVLSGIGAKIIWEAGKLPGYGQTLFQIPASVPTYFGVDDGLVTGAGAAVALVGARKKDSMLTGVGTGVALGVLANKLLEGAGMYVCPFDGILGNGHNCNQCR